MGRSLVLLTTLVLACFAASTLLDLVSGSGSRRTLQSGLGIGGLFWTLIRKACFLRAFFLEAQRYIDVTSRSDYTVIEMKGEEVMDHMRVNNVGPSALQGLFWLNIGGERTEALSFAPTQEGGGLSLGTWPLDENGKPFYRIRNLGDGVSDSACKP